MRHRGILAWRKWLAISLAGLGFAVGLAASTVSALAAAQHEPETLRIAVYDVPPYAYVDSDGSISGVSVDLWRRVAEQMEWPFKLIPVADMESILSGLEQGRFDAAIGAITITPERAARVEFSYPAHRSGVAIALRKQTGPIFALTSYWTAVTELGPLIIVILAMLIVIGIAMWIVEQRNRSTAPGSESAVVSMRDGLYWAVVTMTTVGYGDKTPKTMPGRVVAMVWMLSSLVLVSLLSTSLVSRLTAERVESRDLAGSIDLRERKACGGSAIFRRGVSRRTASAIRQIQRFTGSARVAGKGAIERGNQQRRCVAVLRRQALRQSSRDTARPARARLYGDCAAGA